MSHCLYALSQRCIDATRLKLKHLLFTYSADRDHRYVMSARAIVTVYVVDKMVSVKVSRGDGVRVK